MPTQASYRLCLSLLLIVAIAGCGQEDVRTRVAREAPLPGTPRARAQELKIPDTHIDSRLRPLTELTQYENGPGLLVCEPVVGPGSTSLAGFGRGCARWLQFEAGGQGAAARSPLWWQVAFALTRLEDRKLPLTAEHAVPALGRLGATHVAVGELRGSKARATLSYRLYRVSDRTAVGAPLTLSGSLNEIRLGLPATVAQLSRDAGITDPQTAPALLESVPDLEYLGSLDREGGSYYASIDSPRLQGLSERSALASLYRVMACWKSIEPKELETRCLQLLTQAPKNAAAWGVVSTIVRNCGRGEPQPALHAPLVEALRASPQNTQLALAHTQLYMSQKDWKNARGWAQEAIRRNVLDPIPFQLLANCLRGENQSLSEQARKRGGLTTPESEQIWTTNTRRLELFQHAAALDPTDDQIWEAVSYAATLQRNRELAEEALHKSIEYGKFRGEHYWWGIDMYNPGHLNDPAARARFAEIAASAPIKGPGDRIYTAQLLHHRGLKGADGRLYTRVLRTDDERKQVADWVAGKPIPWGGNPPTKRAETAASTPLSASTR